MRRRNFVRQSMLAVGATSAIPIFNYIPKMQGEKLRVGVIGCNGMGWSNIRSMMKMDDVDCVAICDVDANVIEKRLKDYAEMRSNTPDTYRNYEDLLANDAIDAVVIGTPDHWHCKIFCECTICQRGS